MTKNFNREAEFMRLFDLREKEKSIGLKEKELQGQRKALEAEGARTVLSIMRSLLPDLEAFNYDATGLEGAIDSMEDEVGGV